MYRSMYSISALVGGHWSASRFDRFTPGVEKQYKLDGMLGMLQNKSEGRVEDKDLVSIKTRITQRPSNPQAVGIPTVLSQIPKLHTLNNLIGECGSVVVKEL
jgi:hypothetical protein